MAVNSLATKRPTHRRLRYDVVFHTPWIGSIVSSQQALPPGGAETQVLMLATSLARRGLSVAIIVFGRESELPQQFEGVDLVRRSPRERKRLLIGKVLTELKIWPSLHRAPGATIVQRGASVELAVIGVWARLRRRRLVFASANVSDFAYEKMTRRRPILWAYKLGVRLADEIVVQTEEQVRLCKATFGRDARLIRSIEPLGEPQTSVPEAFLWVGRLVSYKRPMEYVELARALPEARFWMVGVPVSHHDSDRHVVESVMRSADELPNLELLAPRPHAEILSLMSRAVASVSTADFEGMPNVLLEAWSRGVPALVLTHDPDKVVTEHGLGGFADGSVEKLVELAREQWRMRFDRAAISHRCRAYIAARHAPENVVEHWIQMLSNHDVLGARDIVTGDTESRCAA